jgi:hypothetical protein
MLRGVQTGEATPELGSMGHCLKNVGCRMANDANNGFVSLLDDLLVDRAAFCAEFPSQLLRYADEYRNRAAHVERMSLEQCREARAFLLDEPPRLLRLLTSSLRSDSSPGSDA